MKKNLGTRLVASAYVPTLATLCTLVVYFGVGGGVQTGVLADSWYWIRDFAALFGLLGGIGCGVVFYFNYRPYTSVRQANSGLYEQLCGELRRIERQREDCVNDPKVPAAYLELEEHCRYVSRKLGLEKHGEDCDAEAEWVLAIGYLGLWMRLQRADELLLLLLLPKHAVQAALHDVLRLGGSTIPDRAGLLQTIRYAITDLYPGSIDYFDALLSSSQMPWQFTEKKGMAAGTQPASSGNDLAPAPPRPDAVGYFDALRSSGQMPWQFRKKGAPLAATVAPPDCDAQGYARMALQTVRSTINEYRDARRYSLVRMRNQSFSSLIVLSLILFAMVALSTIIGVPIENLALATGYFLVAACTGVIARLRAMGQSEFGVEDYGLATMRLLTRPFTSGIAAIFGVGVIGLQPERLLNGGMLSGTLKATDLLHVFSAGMAGAGFLLAAFFGLAPEVVFGRYTRLAENYGKELKDSKASEAASPS